MLRIACHCSPSIRRGVYLAFFTHFVPPGGAHLLVKHSYGDIEYSTMMMGAMSTSLGHCHPSVQPESVTADGFRMCLVLILMFYLEA
jgi:hypothetical protein